MRGRLLLTDQDVSRLKGLDKGVYDAAFHAAIKAAQPVKSLADLRHAKGIFKVATMHTLLKSLK